MKLVKSIIIFHELISLINNFSLAEKLLIIEEVLKGIREEESTPLKEAEEAEKPRILEMAGIINDEEAEQMKTAVEESRKIDVNEW